jgi:phosphate transport system permease protein
MRTIQKQSRHDQVFFFGIQTLSVFWILLFLALMVVLIQQSLPLFEGLGFRTLLGEEWNPAKKIFGLQAPLYGTLITSFGSVVIAAPLSIAFALMVNQITKSWLAFLMTFVVDMLAAIPSVVYGLWGVYVLIPWVREVIEIPLLNRGWVEGPAYGPGLLSSSLILALMIMPTMTSVIREIFKSVPALQKESALALGATRWEMMKIAILAPSKNGIMGGVMLGFARAFGETMAVTMLIGNRNEIQTSLLGIGQTLSSLLANEYSEASDPVHLGALAAVSLVLL